MRGEVNWSQFVTGEIKLLEVHMPEDNNLEMIDNRKIQNMIYTFRNKQVMLDSDLAILYQVSTKRINEQVR